MSNALSLIGTGFFGALALIVAIGAQNAWVLRQGIRREHVWVVVAICALSDALLITVGTAFLSVLGEAAPWLLFVLQWGGVAYLVFFAVRCFISAYRGGGSLSASASAGAGSIVVTTLALTYLNPHVYLDTVLLIGTITNSFGPQKWIVAGGAMLASAVWFTSLGFGARLLSNVLRSERTWRIIDLVIGILMLLIAAQLALLGIH